MNKIIQIVQHLTPGGIEVMALEMLRMKETSTEMLIVSLEGSHNTMLEKWPRLSEFRENLVFLDKPPGYSAKTLAKLVSLFITVKPDAIHTHHIGPLLYGGLAARLVNIKNIIHTEHDAWHLQDKKRRTLEKNILNLVRPTLVADSESVRTAFKHFIPSIEPVVILNGIDTEKFSPGCMIEARKALNLPHDKKIIGCAGRLEKEKGQQTLIRALAELPPSYSLALAGSGSQLGHLTALVDELALSDRVFFLSHLDNMVEFYRSLDVFCLPSFNEGMPLAPLEAQACGIPSVLTNVGGCTESMCPYTGSLVSAGSFREMAEAIHITVESKQQHSPRTFVVNNANAKNMTQQYQTLCLAGY